MGRGKSAKYAVAGYSPDADGHEPTEGTRTQVAILVSLFVGIGALTGVAIHLGAFGGGGVEQYGWTKPRGVDVKGVARANALKAGAAASVDGLLSPLADSLLEEALNDLPQGLAEASGSGASEEEQTDAPPVPGEVYHDLRDADGRPIPASEGAKPVTFGGMPELRSSKAEAKRPAGGSKGGTEGQARDAAAAAPNAKASAPAGRPVSAIPPAEVGSALSAARRQMGSGAPEQAIDGFRAVLATDPANSKARLGLAQALYESNRTTEARGEVRRLLEAEPAHGRALLLMGSIVQEQGPASEAKSYYKLYLKHYPNGTSAPEVRAILDRL
jgi:tetratricopeptide (TPR) repeat protein